MIPGRRWAAALGEALRLLTIVPVPGHGRPAAAPGLTSTFFPIVGALVAAPLVVVVLLPVPPLPRAAAVLFLWTVVTGGLHEDAWADALDASLAPVGQAERRAILKDPHVGAHGLTGTVLLMILRFSALTAVPPIALLVAPVVGRWAMAVSLAVAPPLSETGLGARFRRSATVAGPTIAALLLLVPAALVSGSEEAIVVAWMAGGIAAYGLGRLLSHRLGGLNGDGHGAVGIGAETAVLLAMISPG